MQMNQALSAELNYVFLEKWSPFTQHKPRWTSKDKSHPRDQHLMRVAVQPQNIMYGQGPLIGLATSIVDIF